MASNRATEERVEAVPAPAGDFGRLHEAAADFAQAIEHCNQPLPDDFPKEQMLAIASDLRDLQKIETEAERQVTVHAQAKLRETRARLRDGPSNVERAHNAVFAEIDTLLEKVPSRELVALRPPTGEPHLAVPRADLEAQVAALEKRIDRMDAESRQSITIIDKSRQLARFGDVRVNLEALVKFGATLKAELAAIRIDLEWLSQLLAPIKALGEALGRSIEVIKEASAEVARIIGHVRRVRRLSDRVVAGGRTLIRVVGRMLARQTEVVAPADPFTPGTVFRDIDASWCPEMVVIPAGEFMMGSPDGDSQADDFEKPQHRVRIIDPLAVGRYPVTFEEYDHFCQVTGVEPPDDRRWGRGRRPVINVSWSDARRYVEWLAGETGQGYRLLSEAEWEYVCRAGTTTRYWWGDGFAPENAHGMSGIGRTTEVGSYPPNPFGLHDTHGNVWEWVEDGWHGNYEGAPDDGSAWLAGKDSGRVVRGASWFVEFPRNLRAAFRGRNDTDDRYGDLGFRLARTLTS